MTDFPTINRYAIIIEPSVSYFEWTKTCPDADPNFTLEELQVESKTYLIPETNAEPVNWLKQNFKTIFEHKLEAWYTDENYWPEKMTYKLFKEFFNIRYSTMVVDMGKDGIERDA